MTLNVNGKNYTVNVPDTSMPLLWVLRDILGLTGTKYGCGIEVCGACTVVIDGQREHSCVVDVGSAAGRAIVTVEGTDPNLKLAQTAWVNHQVPQCGYCQPGMLMGTTSAMNAGNHGTDILNEVPHICICGTYQRIKDAAATL
jgi:isoquinoline 1-oxidoreductase alpha subunit